MNQPLHPQPQSGPTGFVTGVWNPEDLLDLPGSPWIVVGAMRSRRRPGALLAVRRDRPDAATKLRWTDAAERGRLGPGVFDPHGIAARPLGAGVFELLVIDHGGGEAVARLRIEIRDDCLAIVAGVRIVQPSGTSGNALAPLPNGGFVLTSMFDPGDPGILTKFAEGRPTGGVWLWTPKGGWSRFGTLDLSGANGIAVAPDGSAVYVSEWSARRVWRLGPEGEPARWVRTRFLPDNLRWTSTGRLLLAGQAARPEAVFGCEARGEVCPMGFEVVVVDPDTFAVTSLAAADDRQARTWGFGAPRALWRSTRRSGSDPSPASGSPGFGTRWRDAPYAVGKRRRATAAWSLAPWISAASSKS